MIDSITLEVLRCKLEAIAEDGSRTIRRTAISPLVAEAGDCSCTIYDAQGGLVVGGGIVQIHFQAGCNGIAALLDRHGDTIAPGDVFLVNDPYNGGGLHAQDVFVHTPIFDGETLAGWVGTSAHMLDMGGMVPGSFSTSATEVYQEAFRVPSVRLYRAGVEQSDVWAILRNNIRMANVVEMDLRSLISGAYVVREQVAKVVAHYGADVYLEGIKALSDLTEAAVRRRIDELEPGTYRNSTWSEWSDEVYHIPCELTVADGKLTFDFHGASPQTQHFLNSKAYVITSLLGVALTPYLIGDLPMNDGLFRTFEVLCEPGSILDAQSPAPIGGPHLDVGQAAIETAMRALNLAIAASPRSKMRSHMAGGAATSPMAIATFFGKKRDGEDTGWVMIEGTFSGACAGHDRDALPMTFGLTSGGTAELVDTEVMESWYPMRYLRRELHIGVAGGGQYNAGRPSSVAYAVDGAEQITMTLMGNRERVPISGMAGGLPGNVTRWTIQRGDGAPEFLACHQENILLKEGDVLTTDPANGGGWGDPLLRARTEVETEIEYGYISREDGEKIYGVVVGDEEATAAMRSMIRADRLARAVPAQVPLEWNDDLRRLAEGACAPLAPNVEQRGSVAVAERSGAPLSVSPRPWIEGCPRIENAFAASADADVVAYLDPLTGDYLAVDVRARGEGCSFESRPQRWLQAAA